MCCDFSSCCDTERPVGTCVILTALSVVLTDCPPGPPALKTSIRKSISFIFKSTLKMNIQNAIKFGIEELKEKNIQSYFLDSEVLMSKVIGKERKYLILNSI